MSDVLSLARSFTFEEVKVATNDFSTKIGEGGFGGVFYGTLTQGEDVAVKVLSKNSSQGFKEFYNEVAVLSRVRHKNLVSLVGICINTDPILVYEYVSKGALRDHLYGALSADNPLSWKTRLLIAVDAALGLEYLHSGSDPRIIHRDVKSSNILLNDKMQAKVGDFGLSKLKYGESATHVSTLTVAGSAGYLDPAYYSTYQLTNKSDVFSFGVVLFEIVCGRPPIDFLKDPPYIVEWIRPLIQGGNIGDAVDPALGNNYGQESMWKVINIALWSVENDRNKRPTMSEVVRELKEAVKMEIGNVPAYEEASSSLSADGRSF